MGLALMGSANAIYASPLYRHIHRFDCAVARVPKWARQRLDRPLAVNSPASKAVFTRWKSREQRGPVDLRQAHRPGQGPAGGAVKAQRSRGNLAVRERAPLAGRRENLSLGPASRIVGGGLGRVGLDPDLDL